MNNNSSTNFKKYLNRRDVAKYLAISCKTLDRWRNRSELEFPQPLEKFLPILRWKIESIQAWISRRTAA